MSLEHQPHDSSIRMEGDILKIKIVPNVIFDQEKELEVFDEFLRNRGSVSKYEERNLKSLRPQIWATFVVSISHIVLGMVLAFSAILFPKLRESGEIQVDENTKSWIASVIPLSIPIGGVGASYFMDKYGRLFTVKLGTIPGIAGWVTIALAGNVSTLIIGRILSALGTSLIQGPVIVYITEIARADMRGSLISALPAMASLGMMLTFLKGWLMDWRQVAWCCNGYLIVSCLLVFLVPESPAWLVTKGRIEDAKKSLKWFNRSNDTLSEIQLTLLRKDHIENGNRVEGGFWEKVKGLLLEPTGYKPMLVLSGMFLFQQLSGIFIFLFHSIDFFKDAGSTFNPYLASIFIGLLRFIISMINTYLLSTFGRRPMMLLSSIGMTSCIFLSGLFSFWLHNGTSTASWVPLVLLLSFVVFSMLGMVPIPFTMTAEVFPIKIRGLGQSVVMAAVNLMMFATLQFYPALYRILGGIAEVQYFFAASILISILFIYAFTPETHGRKLKEIEEYFKHNVVYVWAPKPQQNPIVHNQNMKV